MKDWQEHLRQKEEEITIDEIDGTSVMILIYEIRNSLRWRSRGIQKFRDLISATEREN